MFLKFVLKNLIKGKLRLSFAEKSPVYRGLRFYNSVKTGKKPLKQVYVECKKLYNYWDGCWPDTYFRFGMFVEGYGDEEKMCSFVPQDAYYRYSKQTTDELKYNLLIDDKILCHDMLSFYGFPVPERFFVFRNNEFRSKDRILSDAEVDEILSTVDDKRIFVKKFTGGAASGISILQRNENQAGNQVGFYDKSGMFFTAATIREKYSKQSIIFEKQIKQHPVLSCFNPETVNTIRVLTYENKVIAATIRFGRKGSFVDNTAKGGIAVALDIETGELGSWGMREYEIEHYYEHPDTHLKFKGVKIDLWPQVKSLVETVSQFMPYYRSVGFDIALTLNGPIVVEINTGAGVYLSQMGYEYGLGKFFKKMPK